MTISLRQAIASRWQARQLDKAILRARALATPQAHAALLARLRSMLLYVAVPDAEDLPAVVDGRLLADEQVPMLTSVGPEGEVLFVFTSPEELNRRVPGAALLALPLETVACRLGDNLAGIVVNPAGNWAFVPAAELRRNLEPAEAAGA